MMNKSRKNTNRPAGGQGGGGGGNITRSSPRPKGPVAEGVYNNPHFLHAAALQMGNNVIVKTRGGVAVEGIFRAFSEDFSIALEVPHSYPIGAPDKKIDVNSVQDNLIVKVCDIVSIQAKDVDLDYATRDTFQTDTAISARLNGSLKFGEKKLQPWEGDTNGDYSINFELDSNSNGWDANEMFSLNEKEHGIKTTFKDNLESYTVQIDRKNTDDFKEKEKEAARIAAEIEGNTSTRERLELENGDEEAAFSAVVRPDDSASNSEKTSPPPNNNNTQKYTSGQQKQSNRQPQDRKIVPQGAGGGGGKPMYSKSTTPMQQQQGAIQQTVNAVGFKGMTILHSAPQYQQPPPSHYASQQQNQNDNKNVNSNESNNNSNTNNKPVQQQQQQQRPNRMMNPQIPMNFNEPPPNMNPVSNQHMGKPPVMSVHMPPPPSHDQQTIHVVQQPVMQVIPPTAIVVPPPGHAIHAPPQAQRAPRGEMMRNQRSDDIRNLRQFHSDFTLAQGPAVVQQPQVPTTQDMNQIVEIKSGNVQHHPTPSSTPHSVILSEKAQTPPTVATPSLQTSNSNSSVANSASNETTPPSSNDKPAKKLITALNPNAKPFTPRSPSTPTQSRPHTPQTPGPMAAQQPAQAQQIPPPQPMYFYAIQPQRPTPPPIQVRSSQKFHQFQVTQATGQPIFNPPVPPQTVMQAFHPHPPQIQQPQAYQPTQLRMYDVQGQQGHVTQYIVQQPPTSTTPSPGHPQQVFHPAQQQSQSGGPPPASFPQQQYVMLMQYPTHQYTQHNPQTMQVVMPQQPAQHQSQ